MTMRRKEKESDVPASKSQIFESTEVNGKQDWKKTDLSPAEHKFSDDGTLTYFWRAHTLSVLFILIGVLIYVAIFEPIREDTSYNTKRGLVACVLVFILLGVTVTPDGVFKRPHPAVWRFTFCCSIVYELGLIFVLFQTKADAIRLLKHIDPELGVPLKEKSYGGNCRIYDHERPDDPFHNIWDKLDLFVPTHFLGWWLKTLVLRDWWLCTVLSVLFELLEYTLEHQLPNFSECWWDHWIMDALVCNGLGIYLGMKTLQYFSLKTYHWRGLWAIPTYKGKLKRLIAQFGPYSWIDYDWRSTSSLGRWLATLGIIFVVYNNENRRAVIMPGFETKRLDQMAGFGNNLNFLSVLHLNVFSVAELNTFYLKFVMWVPPEHYLNLVRLFLILFWGAVSMREVFQYLDDPDCTKIGRQSWTTLAIIATEFLIVTKFDRDTITKPIPRHILFLWLIFLLSLVVWTVWRFFLSPASQKLPGLPDVDLRRQRWALVRSCEVGNFGLKSD